jgi:hypothetical protein
MTTQAVTSPLKVEWDDSVVMVFSFNGPSGRVFCGFVHQILALQFVTGNQTQLSAAIQVIQQQGIQASLDPQSWVETVKTGARGAQVTVTYDDTNSVIYTTQTWQGAWATMKTRDSVLFALRR